MPTSALPSGPRSEPAAGPGQPARHSADQRGRTTHGNRCPSGSEGAELKRQAWGGQRDAGQGQSPALGPGAPCQQAPSDPTGHRASGPWDQGPCPPAAPPQPQMAPRLPRAQCSASPRDPLMRPELGARPVGPWATSAPRLCEHGEACGRHSANWSQKYTSCKAQPPPPRPGAAGLSR